MNDDPLAALARLADLQAQAAAQRMAPATAVRARIAAQRAALRDAPPPTADPADVQAAIQADRFSRWRMQELARLGIEAARIEAELEPLRQARARAAARAQVVATLAARAAAGGRR